MPGELVPIVFLISTAFIIVALTRIITDSRTRRHLIQTGLAPDQVQAILSGPGRAGERASVLKWALVTGSIGLALVVLQFLPYDAYQPITYGVVLIFAAAGLLAYLLADRHLA